MGWLKVGSIGFGDIGRNVFEYGMQQRKKR